MAVSVTWVNLLARRETHRVIIRLSNFHLSKLMNIVEGWAMVGWCNEPNCANAMRWTHARVCGCCSYEKNPVTAEPISRYVRNEIYLSTRDAIVEIEKSELNSGDEWKIHRWNEKKWKKKERNSRHVQEQLFLVAAIQTTELLPRSLHFLLTTIDATFNSFFPQRLYFSFPSAISILRYGKKVDKMR